MALATKPQHPAKYSDALLPVFAKILKKHRCRSVLDPMAGVGKIGLLRDYGFKGRIVANEIEPEWAVQAPPWVEIHVGDAANMDWARDGEFDAIVTSPCLAQKERVLTHDLRWVPVGDIKVGDRLLAFDEQPPGVTRGGLGSRRRWRVATVVRSEPKKVECVRVILENGDEVITTPEHPWLAWRYSYKGHAAKWVSSRDLMGSKGIGSSKAHRRGERQPYYVALQVRPWKERVSYEAGWLAGLFDGEGSLSLSQYGSPKMMICQVDGPVLDRAEALMRSFGYNPNRIPRKSVSSRRQPVSNLYVTGGFPGILTALGELRPTRLLRKWEELDVSSRTIAPSMVRVVAVEPAGRFDIQEIETSTGTYIGEGYLMHNCYGNRMADHHNAKDGSRRYTYRHMLGRPLHPASTGKLQWGEAYQEAHRRIWAECIRVLKWGGIFVLNCKNHIRKGQVIEVSEWHADELYRQGLTLLEHIKVPCPGMRNGANASLRVTHEDVWVFRKPR